MQFVLFFILPALVAASSCLTMESKTKINTLKDLQPPSSCFVGSDIVTTYVSSDGKVNLQLTGSTQTVHVDEGGYKYSKVVCGDNFVWVAWVKKHSENNYQLRAEKYALNDSSGKRRRLLSMSLGAYGNIVNVKDTTNPLTLYDAVLKDDLPLLTYTYSEASDFPPATHITEFRNDELYHYAFSIKHYEPKMTLLDSGKVALAAWYVPDNTPEKIFVYPDALNTNDGRCTITLPKTLGSTDSIKSRFDIAALPNDRTVVAYILESHDAYIAFCDTNTIIPIDETDDVRHINVVQSSLGFFVLYQRLTYLNINVLAFDFDGTLIENFELTSGQNAIGGELSADVNGNKLLAAYRAWDDGRTGIVSGIEGLHTDVFIHDCFSATPAPSPPPTTTAAPVSDEGLDVGAIVGISAGAVVVVAGVVWFVMRQGANVEYNLINNSPGGRIDI